MKLYINKISTLNRERINISCVHPQGTINKEILFSSLKPEEVASIKTFVDLFPNSEITIPSIMVELEVTVHLKNVTIDTNTITISSISDEHKDLFYSVQDLLSELISVY